MASASTRHVEESQIFQILLTDDGQTFLQSGTRIPTGLTTTKNPLILSRRHNKENDRKEQEQQELTTMTRKRPNILITGTPGVGKTATASLIAVGGSNEPLRAAISLHNISY